MIKNRSGFMIACERLFLIYFGIVTLFVISFTREDHISVVILGVKLNSKLILWEVLVIFGLAIVFSILLLRGLWIGIWGFCVICGNLGSQFFKRS